MRNKIIIKTKKMNKEKIKKLEEILKLEKEGLTKELESFAIKDNKIKDNWNAQIFINDESDKEEKIDESIEYNQLVSLEENMEVKLRDVNLALEKIQKNKYGICEKCNNEIEEERLQAYPEAKVCISCNKK